MTSDRRDRYALIGFLGFFIITMVGYCLADAMGWIPARCSVRAYAWRRANPIIQQPEYVDPDLALGILIGDTRFRLNYETHHAIVMQPIRGVETWVIPARIDYRGEQFTVTALNSFALLNAIDVQTVSLPPSVVEMNQAEEIMDHPMEILIRKE